MASPGSGTLFSSTVNVSGATPVSYTVPSGYFFCGQMTSVSAGASVFSIGGGSYNGQSVGGTSVALGIVAGEGLVLSVSGGTGTGSITGALFKNP